MPDGNKKTVFLSWNPNKGTSCLSKFSPVIGEHDSWMFTIEIIRTECLLQILDRLFLKKFLVLGHFIFNNAAF